MNDDIQKMEDRQVPQGRIDLVGCGRLGLRIAINLMQVHRGGPKTIGAFDGQKIDGGDVIFTLLGAKPSDNKTDFIKQLCTHDEKFRNIESHPEYIDEDNIDLLEGDVVIIVIAGGNTIPTAAKIIKHAQKKEVLKPLELQEFLDLAMKILKLKISPNMMIQILLLKS